jgi:ribA/ribD-fused uncharacterized protein
VKFLSFKDRQTVWSKSFTLSRTHGSIFEDYPAEVQANRKILWPIFKFAKGSAEFDTVSLNLDKLYLNKKLFTVNNLHELPESLNQKNRAVKCTDKTVVFYSLHSVFSNFHSAEVVISGDRFCCNEQFFQRAKALMFGDYETADKIMSETDPYKINVLGKKVRGHKKEVWEKKAYKTLKHVNEVKFSQNLHARQALLDTGDLIIGEASPDRMYGTGIHISSSHATDETKWIGKNLMGQILTEIRQSLKTQ